MSILAKSIVSSRKNLAVRFLKRAIKYFKSGKIALGNRAYSKVINTLLPTLLGMARVGHIHRKFETIFLAQDSASNSNAKKLAGLKPCFRSQVSAIVDAIGKTYESLVSKDIKYPKMIFDSGICDTYLIAYFARFASNEYRYIVFPRQRKTNVLKAEKYAIECEKSAFATTLELELYRDIIVKLTTTLYSTFDVEDITMHAKHANGDKSFKGYTKAKSQGYEMIAKINRVIKSVMQDSIAEYRHIMLAVARDYLLAFAPLDEKLDKNKWK